MGNSNKYSIDMLDRMITFWILHKQLRVQYVFTDKETQDKWDELFQSISSNATTHSVTQEPMKVRCDRVMYAGYEIIFISHDDL